MCPVAMLEDFCHVQGEVAYIHVSVLHGGALHFIVYPSMHL